MDCYICGNDTRSIEVDDHLRVACSLCGEYRISRAAIRLLTESNGDLDVEMMKRWVKSYRNSEKLPMIGVDMVATRLRSK